MDLFGTEGSLKRWHVTPSVCDGLGQIPIRLPLHFRGSQVRCLHAPSESRPSNVCPMTGGAVSLESRPPSIIRSLIVASSAGCAGDQQQSSDDQTSAQSSQYPSPRHIDFHS